jgi:hypothetical protein
MAEEVAKQMSRLLLKMQNMHAEIETGRTAVTDLSLLTLIPKYTGTVIAIPLQEFFETIETSACV